MSATKNVAAARAYLTAIERGATGDELAAFFMEDVVQQEFPNRLNAIESGETVVLEVLWTGTMAIAVAGLPAGGEMRARFAVFLEYRDGQIARQRNYDCFDPW